MYHFRTSIGLGLTLMACSSGCSYTTERPFPEHVRSVCVDIFHNRDFRKDLEYRLTEAIIKRIEMDTPYHIQARQHADTLLTGEIIAVQQNTLGNDFRTGLPREQGATFIISYRWKELRTGKILVERQRFPFTTTYIPPVGETFFEAQVRGLEGVAIQLVESLEVPW